MVEIAADLDKIERELRELQADATLHNLHRAVERIDRMRLIASTTARGLKLQSAKAKSMASP
jgi:hypothetical protein